MAYYIPILIFIFNCNLIYKHVVKILLINYLKYLYYDTTIKVNSKFNVEIITNSIY